MKKSILLIAIASVSVMGVNTKRSVVNMFFSKKKIKKLLRSFGWLKFRFDVGSIVVTIIQFVLILILANDKIVDILGITGKTGIILVNLTIILIIALLVILLGDFLVKHGFYEETMEQSNKKNEKFLELLERVKNIEGKLNEKTKR